MSYKTNSIKAIKFTNDTAQNSAVLSPLLSGSSHFSIAYSSCSSVSLKPKQSCVVKILLSNQSLGGNLNASLSIGELIINMSAVAENVGPQSVSFRFNGVNQSELDFGTVNSSFLRSVEISNNGKIPAQLGTTSLSNSHFSILLDQCSNITLEAQKKCLLKVFFNPNQKLDGIYDTSLSVGSFSITMKTNLMGGALSNPTNAVVFESYLKQPLPEVQFGNVGEEQTQIIVITNKGTVVETLPVSLSSSAFKIKSSNCNIVAPRSNCLVRVSFDPKKIPAGQFDDVLNVGNYTLRIKGSNLPEILNKSVSSIKNYDGVLYTNNSNPSVDLIPSVAVKSNSINEDLTVSYSLDSNCSNGGNFNSLNLVNNTINQLYVKVSDSNGASSSCQTIGSVVHDNIIPSVNFNIASNISLPNINDVASLPFSFSRTVSDSNLNNDSLTLFNNATCDGTGNLIGSLSNVPTVKNNYISVKATAYDKAGNIREVCSPSIFLETTLATTAEFENLPSNIALGKKIVPYKIIVKDQYGQKFTKNSVSVEVSSIGLVTETYSTSNGEISLYLTNSSIASKAGVNLLKVLPTNTSLNLKIVGNSNSNNQNITAYRRNCSELHALDNITAGTYTIDLDEEGPMSPIQAECAVDESRGWTMFARTVRVSGSATQSNQVLNSDTNSYLQQVYYDELKKNPYAFRVEYATGKVFALSSDILQDKTFCQNIVSSSVPMILSGYTYYGHFENSGCNATDTDYSLVYYHNSSNQGFVSG